MLCIQEELGQLSVGANPIHIQTLDSSDSSQETTIKVEAPAMGKEGWIDGLLGCLRPVWTIIGKATANEIKGHHQGMQGDRHDGQFCKQKVHLTEK